MFTKNGNRFWNLLPLIDNWFYLIQADHLNSLFKTTQEKPVLDIATWIWVRFSYTPNDLFSYGFY